ncbi:MAG: MFS transporter [Eggerthellaceae bacterium]|jgi:sugar phosphate permease
MTTAANTLTAATGRQSKFFFGWWVVAAGFIIMATCYTVFINCMSLFQAYIVSDLNTTMSAFNLSNTCASVASVVGALFVGTFVDKYPGRVLGAVGVITTAVVLVLMSQVTAVWQLYVLFTVVGIVALAGLRLLISIIVTNWFTLKRGLAVSIALAGSGFGGAILSPVAGVFIVNYGWRPALVLLAVVVLVAALPLVLYSFYSHPQDRGLEPYGAHQIEAGTKADKSPDKMVDVAVGWKAVKSSPSFWLLVVGFVAMGIVNGAVLPNQVTNMTQVKLAGDVIVTGGHTTLWASGVLSLYMVTVVVAKISLGAIYDRFGLNAGNIFGTVACCVATVALCFPQTDIGPIVAAIAFGIGTCMGTVAPPISTVKQYGIKDLGKITGIVTSVEMVSYAAATLMSGTLFDMYHSFAPMWIICLVCSVVMGVTLVASRATSGKLIEKCRTAGAPKVDASGNVIEEIAEEAEAIDAAGLSPKAQKDVLD